MNAPPLQVATFFAQIKSYVSWREVDRQRVAAAWPIVQPIVGEMVDDFYQTIESHDFTARIVTGGREQIERLKTTLAGWVESLFSGKYDLEFALSRCQVGRRHVEIGLDQAYALAAVTRLRLFMTRRLCEAWPGSKSDLCHTVIAVNKLLDIDSALIHFAYQQSFAARLEESATIKVKQSERLAAIGQMVTGLAHESRNVLQRSHACLEALEMDIEDRPEALKQAHRIQAALDRLHLLYEEVRNYAAPINLEREVVELMRLATVVWHNLEPRWSELGTTFSVTCDQPGECQVLGDRHRLDQVLTNLIHNAIEAAGPLGQIKCAIRRDAARNECFVCLEDNGPGIPADQIARVFEPFFTTKTKGTGLGLAITKRIIEAHHGAIQIERSNLGGAKITVCLPSAMQPTYNSV